MFLFMERDWKVKPELNLQIAAWGPTLLYTTESQFLCVFLFMHATDRADFYTTQIKAHGENSEQKSSVLVLQR